MNEENKVELDTDDVQEENVSVQEQPKDEKPEQVEVDLGYKDPVKQETKAKIVTTEETPEPQTEDNLPEHTQNVQKRIDQFVKYFANRPHLTDATVAEYPPAPALEVGGAATSASRMRKAYKDQDWETFKLMLPDDNHYDDVVQVLLQGGDLQENFLNLRPVVIII